jgi:hypothetical protein
MALGDGLAVREHLLNCDVMGVALRAGMRHAEGLRFG